MRLSAARVFCAALTFFLVPIPAFADTVKLFGKPAFEDVTITGIQQNRIVFRGLTRELLRKPLDQVESIELDAAPELALAEAAREADPDAAATLYENILKSNPAPWLEDWIRVRCIDAYERSGRIDRAVQAFVALATSAAPDLERYAPRRLPPPGSPAAQRALEFIADVRQLGGRNNSPRIRRLQLELLIYEDVAELPPEFAAALPRVADPQPEGELLFGSPSPAEADKETRLPLDSIVFEAARDAAAAGNHVRTVRMIERGLPFARGIDDRELRLVLGRSLFELARFEHALAALSRLVDSVDRPELAADALYYSGLAQQRLGRLEQARRMLSELAIRPGIRDDQRRRATRALDRLGDPATAPAQP